MRVLVDLTLIHSIRLRGIEIAIHLNKTRNRCQFSLMKNLFTDLLGRYMARFSLWKHGFGKLPVQGNYNYEHNTGTLSCQSVPEQALAHPVRPSDKNNSSNKLNRQCWHSRLSGRQKRIRHQPINASDSEWSHYDWSSELWFCEF